MKKRQVGFEAYLFRPVLHGPGLKLMANTKRHPQHSGLIVADAVSEQWLRDQSAGGFIEVGFEINVRALAQQIVDDAEYGLACAVLILQNILSSVDHITGVNHPLRRQREAHARGDEIIPSRSGRIRVEDVFA